MQYFAMGDSNMIGANTGTAEHNYSNDPDNFFNILARNLQITFECHAKNGASNDHIIRKTEEWISKSSVPNNEKFVFIGWSTWERQEHLIDGKWFDIDSWSINFSQNAPTKLGIMIEDLKTRIKNEPDHMRNCARHWSEKIQNWAMSLQQRGIQYFFWNTYMPLEPLTTGPILFDHRYVFPYDNKFTMFFYLKHVRNFSTQARDPYHFDKSAHHAWAEFLTQYIHDWNILKKQL